MKKWHAAALVCVVWFALPAGMNAQEKKPPKVTYVDDVMPIFRQKCFSCHNADKKSGDLDLTNYGNLMLGGGSGEVVEAGDSSASYLYMLLTHESEPYMPPEQPKLPDEMLETIRKWIDGGVLETKSSKARVKKKKTFDLALADTPTERPAVAPVPPRLSLQPITRTSRSTAASAIATSPWAPLAAVAGQKQVLLYDTNTLQLVGTLPFPEGTPHVLKFSRNGSLLLVGGGRGGASGKAIVWNIHTGERVFEVGDELDTVLAADISSDQTLVALGGPQRVVRIYSTESGRLLHELRKHTDWIYSIEFSPDSVLLATGDRNGGLFVWEGWTGREYLTLKAHSKGVTDVSWRSDSNILASCSEDGSIRLWEMNNGGQVKNWGGHGGGATSLEFTRDGQLVSCGRDRVAKLWDQNGKQIRAFEAFGDLALEASYCDETGRAIAGDWSGTIRVWNAADGARVGELSSNPPKLAERLQAANVDLTAKQTAHKPLAEAYQVAQTAANKAAADLKKAQETLTTAQKKTTDSQARLKTAQQGYDKTAGEHKQLAEMVTKLTPAVPALKEAAAKAKVAVAKLPKDDELAKSVKTLETLAAAREETLKKNQTAAATKATELKKMQEKLATDKAAYDTATKELTKAQQDMAKVEPLVKQMNEKAAAAKQASDASAAALASAQKAVARWTDEIAFAGKLEGLLQQRKELEKQLSAREETHDESLDALDAADQERVKAEADLKQAQELAAAEKKNYDKQVAAVAAAKAALAKEKKAEAAITAQITGLEKLLQPLGEALAKANAAAAAAAGDKEVAQVVAQIKSLFDRRKAELATARKALEEKKKVVVAATKAVADAEQQMKAAAAKLDAATKKVAEVQAAGRPLMEKAAAAKAAADKSLQEVTKVEEEIKSVQQAIADHKGVKTG